MFILDLVCDVFLCALSVSFPCCFGVVFFFFKQKTAYEIRLSLVGSEMCIRDRVLLNGYYV